MTQSDDPSIFDNAVLDEYQLPVDAWADQGVDWVANNLSWFLDSLEWPFSFLVENLIDNFMIRISWVWIVGAMFLIAWLIRGVRVATFVASALVACALLGSSFWIQTVRSIGLVTVAVFFCVIIGIPLGVAAAQSDAVWRVLRPVLDAMQVVHPFVYLVPFVFFWGIGPAPATMMTMVFALPPLVRLTHLGIRQVPRDLVDASRAFGASDWRVFVDVQLPLARPAIATGLNQTLLLSIYMLAIAAIMGAGGLGRVMFQALTGQDLALATSSGLAYFLVAVSLDRISQPDDGDPKGLIHRIRRALAAHDPESEVLLAELIRPRAIAGQETGRPRKLEARELLAMLLAALGAVAAVVSVFLVWANDGGYLSSFGRHDDEQDSIGQSFDGLSPSGGSWFGFLTLALGLFVILSVVVNLAWPASVLRWMSPDGLTIASVGLAVMNIAHMLADPAELSATSRGPGIYVAVVASVIAGVGAVLWTRISPHAPLRPLGTKLRLVPLVGVGAAVLVLVAAAFSGWSFDNRSDTIISAEVQAQIDQLAQEGHDDPSVATVNAVEITALVGSATNSEAIVIDGVSGAGTRLGLWSLLAGIAAFAAAIPTSGLLGRDEHRQWLWGSVTAGCGAGIVLIGVAWIATTARSADPGFVSGIGSLLAVVAGFVILSTTHSVIGSFSRQRVYGDAARPSHYCSLL